MLATLLLAQLLTGGAQPPDLSGRYEVVIGGPTVQPTAPTAGVLLLTVRNGRVRAAVGPSAEQLRPVTRAALSGISIVLTIGTNQMEWRLTIGGDRLSGEAHRGTQIDPLVLKRLGPLTSEDRARLLPPLQYEEVQSRSTEIVALREALEDGHDGALDAFWESVERRGTPLIEHGDGGTVLATFLWRGSSQTRSVLLERGRFTYQQPVGGSLFSHIEGTDVWFKTLRLPRDARFTYRLAENDPLAMPSGSSGPRAIGPDRLNPRTVDDARPVPASERRSLAEMPAAPEQPWLAVREGTAAFSLGRHRVTSAILGNDREILVYTPPGYDPNGAPYPTVYLFDGDDPGGPIFQAATIENLLGAGRIPPIVVVRIANARGARSRELSCHRPFTAFLADELVPWVQRHYHVSASPADTVLAGQSLGGLAAVCAGLQQPDRFGLLLVQSGSFWWAPPEHREPNWVVSEVLARPMLPLRFYLEAGRFEVDLTGRGGNILEPTRHLRDVLRAKGYTVEYREFAGDHEWINWRGTLADGLIALLGSHRR